MSKLLRKLRQIEYYPKSGDVLSVLVDQISYDSFQFMSQKNDSVGFILVSAFEEIVKLIDVSCGTHVEYYVPTVLTLSKILPMTSSSKKTKKQRVKNFEDLLDRRKQDDHDDDDRTEEEQIERHGIRILRVESPDQIGAQTIMFCRIFVSKCQIKMDGPQKISAVHFEQTKI